MEDKKRVLTAAEKRAARRARVLQGGESRLQLLKGQIASLKEPQALDAQLDAAADELLEGPKETEEHELKIPPRVDPAQRRRDAAARRRKKEAVVEEILKPKEPETQQQKQEPTFSRHATALKLRGLEEKLVLLLIVGVAAYVALSMDVSAIAASLAADDQLFVAYQDLIAKGVPMEAIRQRFEREQLDPSVRDRLELLLMDQLKSDASAVVSSPGWLPDLADVGFFFTSLMAHPPIVLCVLLVRMLVATGAKGLHAALDLPDVTSPQEGDLGFLANLALSSRPVLKDFLVKARKSLDDVFVFIFALVLFVAIRAIWTS